VAAKGKRESQGENVLFAVLIVIFVSITAIMGFVLYGKKPHPPEKTLKVLMAADDSVVQAQRVYTEEYKKLRPDMEIEPVMFPWRNIWQKLEYMIVAGIPPDISTIEQPMLPKFVYLGAVEPLDKWIDNDPDYNPAEYFPECMDESNWDGVQWGIPLDFSTVCVFYNKDIFDEYGIEYPTDDWTVEDLIDKAKKLTIDKDGDGYTDIYGFYTNNNHWHRYSSWVWMAGGDFFTKDLMKCTFDDPTVVRGFTWLADLALKYKVQPSSNDLRGMGSTNFFLSSSLAMIAESRYFVRNFELEKYQDTLEMFDWDVVELPRDKRKASVFLVGNNIIPKTVSDKRKEMAWDYIKFLASDTGQRVLMSMNGAIPTKMNIAEEMMELSKTRKPYNDRAFMRAVRYARYPYRPFPAEEEWMEARSFLQGVWAGRLEVEAVCKRSALNINQAMEKFFRWHPDAHLPLNTKWMPLDERRKAAVDGGDATRLSEGAD